MGKQALGKISCLSDRNFSIEGSELKAFQLVSEMTLLNFIFKRPINQSINQSNNQTINQSSNQSDFRQQRQTHKNPLQWYFQQQPVRFGGIDLDIHFLRSGAFPPSNFEPCRFLVMDMVSIWLVKSVWQIVSWVVCVPLFLLHNNAGETNQWTFEKM